MSLEKLAVIFVIIILPITVVLNIYINAEIDTIKIQIQYDRKLYNATYDAIKAYQINSFNESTSDLANIKMRHINASANSFFNTMESSLSSSGYTKEQIKDYVPALVFTMYDGYYIYSKYVNELTVEDYVSKTEADLINQGVTDEKLKIKPSTYQNGDELYGVKPYIYYSCRYKDSPQLGDDFVITYSLDNYISIQGIVNGEIVNDQGYVIDIDNHNNEIVDTETVTYRNVTIKAEPEDNLREYIDGTDNLYKYHKINGVKYYYEEYDSDNNEKWFSILNGKKIYMSYNFSTDFDKSAYYYYRDAYEFTERLKARGLTSLTPGKAVLDDDVSRDVDDDDNDDDDDDDDDNSSHAMLNFRRTDQNSPIFDIEGIEEPDSNFNEHRLAVIRYSIERNLAIAISNYNKFGTSSTNFQMPELKENEWDKILNNISIISFMQGFPIGNKIYNGCAVVTNSKNSEVVAENSIYIVDSDNDKAQDNNYYKVLSTDIMGKSNLRGVFNIDLEMRNYFDGINNSYYCPKFYFSDYNSVLTSTNLVNISASQHDPTKNQYMYNGNIYKYLDSLGSGNQIATAYYTALGRERYSTYKVTKNAEQVLSQYLE